MNKMRHIIVEIGKRNSIFSSYWLSNDDLINIIELVPIFIAVININVITRFREQNDNLRRIAIFD